VFAEMSKASSAARPNVNTYQLLFKHVRKDSGRGGLEQPQSKPKGFVQNDLDRVIQLFFQLNAQ